MANPTKRKAQKAKKRQERLRAAKLSAQASSLYPSVVIHSSDGKNPFEPLVRKAISELDFTRFPETLRTTLKALARKGIDGIALPQGIEESPGYAERAKRLMAGTALMSIGEQVSSRIDEDTRRKLIPYHDFEIVWSRGAITVKFDSLLSASGGRHGTIYFSRLRPTVEFDGKRHTVGYSRHAIDQLCERLKTDRISYGQAGDIFAFLAKCVYFEPTTLADGSRAICLFNGCDNEIAVESDYLEYVLGADNLLPGAGNAYYRLGYAPIAIEDEYAKALTFLNPGFSKTREYALLQSSRLPRHERERLARLCTQPWPAEQVRVSGALEAIKWFHDNGIPQVVQMRRMVFNANGLACSVQSEQTRAPTIP